MKTTHTALLCVLALAIGLTSGCGKSKNEASNASPKQTQDEQGMAEAEPPEQSEAPQSAKPAASEPASPEPSSKTGDDESEASPMASPLASPEETGPEATHPVHDYPDTQTFIVLVGDKQESTLMHLHALSFKSMGGPDAGIYLDDAQYDILAYADAYVVTPSDSGEGNTYLEIKFIPNVTGKDIAETVFDDYSTNLVIKDRGDSSVTYGSARIITGDALDKTSWIAYVIDTDKGVICAVMRLEPDVAGIHGPRLEAAAGSIFVK